MTRLVAAPARLLQLLLLLAGAWSCSSTGGSGRRLLDVGGAALPLPEALVRPALQLERLMNSWDRQRCQHMLHQTCAPGSRCYRASKSAVDQCRSLARQIKAANLQLKRGSVENRGRSQKIPGTDVNKPVFVHERPAVFWTEISERQHIHSKVSGKSGSRPAPVNGTGSLFLNCIKPGEMFHSMCVSCSTVCKFHVPGLTFVHVKYPCACALRMRPHARHVYMPLDDVDACRRRLNSVQEQFREWWVETASVKRAVEGAVAGASVRLVPHFHLADLWQPVPIKPRARRVGVLGKHPLPRRVRDAVQPVLEAGGAVLVEAGLPDVSRERMVSALRGFDVAIMWDQCDAYSRFAEDKYGAPMQREDCLSCKAANRLVSALALGIPTLAHSQYESVRAVASLSGYSGVVNSTEDLVQRLHALVAEGADSQHYRQMLQAEGKLVWRLFNPESREATLMKVLEQPEAGAGRGRLTDLEKLDRLGRPDFPILPAPLPAREAAAPDPFASDLADAPLADLLAWEWN